MTKVGWRSKAIYLLFALALVVGLFGGVTTVYAQSVLLTATPDEGLASLDVDFTATVTPGNGPYIYTFDWIHQYKQQEGDAWCAAGQASTDFPLLFDGADFTVTGSTSDTQIIVPHRFNVPGFYNVEVSVQDLGGGGPYTDYIEVRVLGIIPADIAFDVKGACHTIEVKGVETNASAIIWSLGSGVDLTPADILSCTGETPETWVAPSPDAKQTMIQIQSMKRGDIHIYATVIDDSMGNITLHTEKKWGELQGTELDLDILSAGKPHVEPTHAFGANEIGTHQETLEDLVEGTLLSLPGNKTMGHAIVHWFLFEDEEETEGLIDDLMDHVASQEIGPGVYGDVIDDAYWEAYGKYDTEDLRDLISAPSDAEPYDVLEYYASDATQLRHADPTIFEWTDFIDDEWYFQNETADSWPTEDRGTAQAQLNVSIDDLEQGESICVMIVLLVTYPGSGDPKDDPYNGENIIVIEKGKKCFTKGRRPEVTLVKTPQVRWAGEKVVLEQDWSDYLAADTGIDWNTAEYRLDEASVGVLYSAGDNSCYGGSALRVDVNGTNPTSEVVLESEFQGKADVEVALYHECCPIGGSCSEEIVLNYGFPVLFLAFEDVTSACDITPEADRLGLTTDPGGEDADVAVQVRGWFTSDQLGPAVDPDTGQVRAEKIVDTDGDGVFDRALPRGRYVLPDDWPALAGGPFELRPNWDTMDMANEDWGDSIQSTNPLGPYNTQFVANEDPEEVADAPCIGPFNTLQQWSTDDMWFAEAVVPADFTVATPFTWPRTNDDLRTTVVPDGAITEYDCPMPQALVIFNVQPGSHEDAALSELLKTDLYGYGYTGEPGEEIYHSPFYQVEVPTSEWIPAMGYNWDSWNVDGPYPYWDDLELLSILANTLEDAADLDTDDVEVYCDNHGIAAVQIDALEDTGTVWITATADFPMSMKKGQYPAMTSDPLRASWGEILEIDPDLEGTPRTCEEVEGCIVTFTNLSEGGQLPYKSATWDFGDGSPTVTFTTSPEKDYGGTVTHPYTTAGQFIVCITIVDADNFEATQCEGVPGDGYIKVGVPDLGDLIDYYMALTGDPNVVELADLMAAADDWIAGTIPAGFTDPITTIQLMALADEWISS